MTSPSALSEDDDLLAAEYVLGVLEAEARAMATARLRTDAAFAAAVHAWETRLDGLNDGFAEAPAPDLMPAIEARLFPTATAPRPRRTWFGLAAAGALVAGLAVAALFLNQTGPAQAPLLTTLAAADLAYEVRADGETLQVTRIAGAPAPQGQVHELWAIAPGGAAPVSLGLLGEAPLTLRYPVPPPGWVLAVSVEPAGGSPTGAPTGPVILTAEIGA